MNVAFKLIGSVLIVCVGTVVGWQKSATARQRATVLQQMERLIARIEDEITYRATPLPEILARVKAETAFAALNLDECNNLRSYQPPNAMAKEHWKLLQPFFEHLGQTTVHESQNRSHYYQALCEEWLITAAEEACTAKKLYTKMGLCCGAFVALMLL